MAKELVNDSALIRVYQNVLEENELGVETEVKMQATGEFKSKLNDFVFEVISSCIQHARAAERFTLMPEDVPTAMCHPSPEEPEEE